MQTDVQWFVSALIDNELVTLEDATALDNELGGDSDLGTFAQTFLERYVAATGMSEEDSAQLVESIQPLIDYAVEQAESKTHPEYSDSFEPMPFNSGYFMCVKPKGVEAEKVRRMLIEKYSTGTIVLSGLIRLAFSTTPSATLPALFANVAAAVADLNG